MAIDWSPAAIGLDKKFIKEMKRIKKLGYLNLGPKDLKLADELTGIATAQFKTHLVKQLKSDYPVKARAYEVIGISDSVYGRWIKEPRRMSPRGIGLISLMDSRYKNALTAFRQLEDYYFLVDADMPEMVSYVKEDRERYKISRMEELVAEMKRTMNGKASE